MKLFQVDITTDMDVISVLVNASDENEAMAIAQTMFEQGEVASAGTMFVNAVAFTAC